MQPGSATTVAASPEAHISSAPRLYPPDTRESPLQTYVKTGFWEASRRLYQICQELDQDASGFLSFEEFKCGFHTNPEFADLLKVMDIDERDLEAALGGPLGVSFLGLLLEVDFTVGRWAAPISRHSPHGS